MTGLRLFTRGFGPDGPSNFIVLASWHNPRSITWRWALYWYPSDWYPPKRWRGFSGHRHNWGGDAWLTIPLVGTLHFSWQHSMWRTALRDVA